jgi:hypothetical protein
MCGAWRGVVVKVLRYYSDGPGSIFLWHIPSDRLGVDSAQSENEYQEHFLGVKAAGAYHPHVPTVLKIWEPKPPGTLWATPSLLLDCFIFSKLMCIKMAYYILCSSDMCYQNFSICNKLQTASVV